MKPTIVLVEDNPGDVYLFKYAIAKFNLDCDLIVCVDGLQAMDFLTRIEQGQAPLPSLFVLDLNLPYYTGLDLLKQIRAGTRLSACPAMILTSSNAPCDRDSATRLGANLYVSKPTDLNAFVAIGAPIRELLKAA